MATKFCVALFPSLFTTIIAVSYSGVFTHNSDARNWMFVEVLTGNRTSLSTADNNNACCRNSEKCTPFQF